MNLLMESLEHFVCFRALPKKNDAFDNIPVVNDHTVFGVDRLTDLAQPNLRAFVDGGDIPDANWGAVLSPKQRLADLSTLVNRPTVLTLICCCPSSMKLTPPLRLLFASACSTWPMLRPYATSLSGSTATWYSFVVPPKVFTSTTSGTDFNCFTITQSWRDFSSVRSTEGFVLFSE